MKLTPAPTELVATFNAVLPVDHRVRPRMMFGYPCCFVGGHMFMGLFRDRMMVRLAPDDRKELISKGGTIFEPMPGRPMAEYVVVPASVMENQAALREWVAKSLSYGGSLPPKEDAPKPPAKVKVRSTPAATKKGRR